MRNSALFWGAVLVLIGGVLLLDNLGLLGNIHVWDVIWPLFLIVCGARVRAQGGLSTVFVDEARFPRQGDLYQSPDFDSAIIKWR